MRAFLFTLAFLTSPLASAQCLEGFYDLGRQAAALGFICDENPEIAQIIFCKRNILVEQNRCTGERQPINCRWLNDSQEWLCEERGNYPFQAWIKSSGADEISYKFKSSFNEGSLTGRRL